MNKPIALVILLTLSACSAFSQGTLTSYGDSIACGVAASVRYIGGVVADQGKTLRDACWSGRQLADFFASAYYSPTAVQADSEAVMLLGYNDMRRNGTNAAALLAFARAARSLIAFSAIPTANLTLGTSGAVTYTGTWTNTSAWPTIGKWSGTTGATASFTLYGKTIYIDTIQFAGITRGLRVNIDGVDYGEYHGQTFVTTPHGMPYAPYLIQIRGLPLANHLVTLTVGSGTSNAYFNWAVGLDGSPQAPTVTVANTLPMTAAAYTEPTSTPFIYGSDTAVNLYNEAIKDAVRDLYSDGLNVGLADVATGFNLSTMLAADQIHPNNAGHAFIKQKILDSIHQAGTIHGID